jgi:hypothetical protein
MSVNSSQWLVAGPAKMILLQKFKLGVYMPIGIRAK